MTRIVIRVGLLGALALNLCTVQAAAADGGAPSISDLKQLNVEDNKLLVMIDGRTVYTPLYSGVFWDAQDYLLEDIDRGARLSWIV